MTLSIGQIRLKWRQIKNLPTVLHSVNDGVVPKAPALHWSTSLTCLPGCCVKIVTEMEQMTLKLFIIIQNKPRQYKATGSEILRTHYNIYPVLSVTNNFKDASNHRAQKSREWSSASSTAPYVLSCCIRIHSGPSWTQETCRWCVQFTLLTQEETLHFALESPIASVTFSILCPINL